MVRGGEVRTQSRGAHDSETADSNSAPATISAEEIEQTYREIHDREMALDDRMEVAGLKEYVEYLHGEIIGLQNRVAALEREGGE